MLYNFLIANRIELIDRCRSKVALRPMPDVTSQELEDGVPLFLAQLIKTLEIERRSGSLITHRFKLDQIEAAYDLFANQRDGVLKVAISP